MALIYIFLTPIFAQAMMGDINPWITRDISRVSCQNKKNVEVGGISIRGSYHQFEDHSLQVGDLDKARPGGPESRRIVSKLTDAHFSPYFKDSTSKKEKSSLKKIADFLTKNQKNGLVFINKKNVSVEDPGFEQEISQYVGDNLQFSISCLAQAKLREARNETLAIVSMEVEYSNGSIGPHNKPKKWIPIPDEKFKALAAKVVLTSKVNNQLGLVDFFADRSKVQARKFDDIPSGGGYAYYTTIKFSNGQEMQINDYSPYTLSAPFDELFKLVISGPEMPSL